MTTFQPEEIYYGVIDTEMIQFTVSDEGNLHIFTLANKQVIVSKEKWKQKSSFFGPGKIGCSMRYNGQCLDWYIRVYPLREKGHAENMWSSGRNGTFNLPTRPFSSRFAPNDDVIWEDEK